MSFVDFLSHDRGVLTDWPNILELPPSRASLLPFQLAMVKNSQTKIDISLCSGTGSSLPIPVCRPACIRISDTIHPIPSAFHAFVLQKCSRSLPRKNLSCLPVRRCPVFMSPRSLYLRSVPRLIPNISAAFPIGYRPVRLTTGSFIDIAILFGLLAVFGLVQRIKPTQIRPDYLVIFPVFKEFRH